MHDANVLPTSEPRMITTRELAEGAPMRINLDDQVLTVPQVRIVKDGEWAVDFTEPMAGTECTTLHVGADEGDEPLWEVA